jgi:hypothetical protein
MTCAECQRELPDFLEEGGMAELQAHLRGCANCSGLAESLQAIANEARELQASSEPSPRVWNSLEIQLRKEGLIRQPHPHGHRAILPSLKSWGVAAWLMPAAAALVIGAGLLLYPRPNPNKLARNSTEARPISMASGDTSDQQLLQEVSARAPMMRATYESNLRDANAYIRDAQATVNANPNDEEAQQALMDAYGQKSMIYEMALDRSLP